METPNQIKRNLYYTNDHEWIDFQGSVAYIGVCRFKLSGFKEIHKIEFREISDLIKRGEVISSIQFDDYQIQLHMPVEGKIISINELLLTEEKEVLLQQPENNGWIALVVPTSLNDKSGLLSPEDYKMWQLKH
jgi:glycine cleavage system H lipoate-binding protein